MAVEGRLTKKKMIDTASLFKQRRRSIGRGAGSRAPTRLASAALRWPRRGSAAPRLPARRRERRPEIGWSRDCWRCSAANKPALAALGEMKNKTNKLAKRPGSWGGAWAARPAGPWGLVPAAALPGARPPRSPDLPLLVRETKGLDPLIPKVAGSSVCASVFPALAEQGVRADGGRPAPSWALSRGPNLWHRGGAREHSLRGWGPPAWVPWLGMSSVGLTLDLEVSAVLGEAGGFGNKPRRTSFYKLAWSRRSIYNVF
nr:PREDICTED: uncharacterized protein LOC103552731 [Equus przewalskii]